jgi:hypothetical protein
MTQLLSKDALSAYLQATKDTKVIQDLEEEEERLKMYAIRAGRRQASFSSRMFAQWQFALLRHGYKTKLTRDYMWNLTPDDAIARLNSVFARIFDKRIDDEQRLDIKWTLWATVKWDFYTAFFWGLVQFVRCAFSDRIFALEDAIEFHAFAPLEALPCVCPNSIPLGCPLQLAIATLNYITTLKGYNHTGCNPTL